MKLDIRTTATEPRRQAYAHLVRRFGENRLATRYEEAIYDVQPEANFHYRPIYEPEFEIFDRKRTAVVLADWYVLTDPRQFYYATYNISRAAMESSNAKSFEFAEKQGLFVEPQLGAEIKEKVATAMVPMRHYEWGSNRNNWSICDRGFGAAITSAAAFAAMDRLGMAQVITKLGLAIDDQTGASLDAGKKAWLEDSAWQGVRKAVEDSLVVKDWFELFVAQNFALDGVVHRLVFDELRKTCGMGISLVTEIIADVYADQARWVDAVLKTAAAESPANAKLMSGWVSKWTASAADAARPLAKRTHGAEADAIVDRLSRELLARAAKLGIAEVSS